MKWGDFHLRLISDGCLWLDGGAMFGVVPRNLWERKTTPDEKNRIRLAMNCLLVQSDGRQILIDTGCGFKYSRKEIDIYRIEHDTDVVRELERFGSAPDAIDMVINTHLHFDHCGGNTHMVEGRAVPTFPNATYLVRRQEYEDASRPNERTMATYFPHNWEPLRQGGQLRLIDEDEEVAPGITLVHTPGHTAGHQSVKLVSQGRTLFYMADLCPTAAHIPLPWIMGYDLFPLTTLAVRKQIYRQAVDGQWMLFFEHDPQIHAGRLRHRDGRYLLEPCGWEA